VDQVSHQAVPGWLNRFDIFVAPSRLDSESFGVAAVEASACGIPVVVSDVGGLPEVVKNGSTGLIVPRDSPEELASALRRLLESATLREKMGETGRSFVVEEYEWEKCVDLMERTYHAAIDGPGSAG
jgi:glycosyltransferase involved in cell wall biosynthesis